MIGRAAIFVTVGLMLLLCLGAQYLRRAAMQPGILGGWFGGLGPTLESGDYQWMFACLLLVYFTYFTFYQHSFGRRPIMKEGPAGALRSCVVSRGRAISLYALAGVALACYVVQYPASALEDEFLVLIGGLAIGQAVGALRLWQERQGCPEQAYAVIFGFLTTFLTLAALFHPDMGKEYQYRERLRWIGPWDNPNSFGMLMGTGMILALGQVLESACHRGRHDGDQKQRQVGIGRRAASRCFQVLCLLAVLIMGTGLIESYSRGAWVATLGGLLYLGHAWNHRRTHEEMTTACFSSDDAKRTGHWHHWLRLRSHAIMVLTAILILGLLNFRYAQSRLVRRSVSVTNLNDFSWRNRATASLGSLQMIADKPWLGAGWNRPSATYAALYQPPRLVESYVIYLNDYFMLAMILGLPALGCLLFYVCSSFSSGHRVYFHGQELVSRVGWTRAVARAGAAVLMVGFLPEHGLFYIATAGPFWILLELGRDDS